MAGAALATPHRVLGFWDFIGYHPIKSAEVINNGDLVGVDTNGSIINASKTQGATVKAIGVAVISDSFSGEIIRTGVAGLTVKIGVWRRAKLSGAAITQTLVPAWDEGLPLYLGALGISTVTNYTCTLTSTASDIVQAVGYVNGDKDLMVGVQEPTLIVQAAGTTTAALG